MRSVVLQMGISIDGYVSGGPNRTSAEANPSTQTSSPGSWRGSPRPGRRRLTRPRGAGAESRLLNLRVTPRGQPTPAGSGSSGSSRSGCG
jgi:hypothetical protein